VQRIQQSGGDKCASRMVRPTVRTSVLTARPRNNGSGALAGFDSPAVKNVPVGTAEVHGVVARVASI